MLFSFVSINTYDWLDVLVVGVGAIVWRTNFSVDAELCISGEFSFHSNSEKPHPLSYHSESRRRGQHDSLSLSILSTYTKKWDANAVVNGKMERSIGKLRSHSGMLNTFYDPALGGES